MNKLDSLLKLPQTQTFPQGSVLLEEGACSPEGMVVLLKGIAGAYRNYRQYNENRLHTFSPVSCFGEAALFSQQPSPVAVVAMTEVALLKINRESAPLLFAEYPELALLIVESLCRRISALSPEPPADAAQTGVSAAKGKKAAAAPEEVQAVKEKEAPAEPDVVQVVKAKMAAAKAQAVPEAAPPAPAKPEAPAKKPQKIASENPGALFPPQHGTYLLPLENEKPGYLYEQDITCPVCEGSFVQTTVLSSRLRLARMDSDFRQHYKELEPMHYEIFTCPHCLYSAPDDLFESATRAMSDMVEREVAPYKKGVTIQTGKQRDSFTVFAGYYLALLCAPVCFDDDRLHTAKLWVKLSRLYSDCEDEVMENLALNKALEDYRYAYMNYNLNEKVLHQVRYLLGDLYEKLGDIDNARQFFYTVKVDRNINRVLGRQADQRLETIRERLQAEKAQK